MERLNNYVLMEIFEYLDGSTLKCCMETCSSWAEIIGSSLTTMKKLPLIVDNERMSDQKENLEQIKTLKRNYHSLIIDEVRVTCLIVTPLKALIGNIRLLELIHVDQTDASWKTLLRNLNSIETITIVESKHSNNRKVGKEERIKIPTLKFLTVIDSDWSFFEAIGETQMEELKIHHRSFYPTHLNYFLGFLKLQTTLSSLAIRVQQASIYKVFANGESNSLKFRLKKLSVTHKNYNDLINEKNLLEFLDLHKESLEHFETVSRLSPKIYEHLFTKMKLKSLMLNASSFPRDSIKYNTLRSNPHLIKLVLTGELKDNDAAQGFFAIYRKIKILSINNWSADVANDILVTIINNLTMISHLKIPYLVENTPELQIASLKKLHIESIDTKINLQSIILNQNNLEKISVKWINDDVNEAIEQASTRLNKLQRASFGPGFKPTCQTLKALKDNCPNLHTLEVFYDGKQPISENILSAVNGNRFKVFQYKNYSAPMIFTFEKSMWHEEDKIFINLSSQPTSDTESMDDSDSDGDIDFGDTSDDDSFENNPFYNYYSDSDDMDFNDYMMREVIGFLIN
ncbi:uncharacterized protein [Chironomus tepperi]|uniref:uncharacterized protein n=1 Tax=Chironomus tepperi TaxID=113505 RepID=UPI00391F8608